MDSSKKSSEYLDMSNNNSNDFLPLESNLSSIESEEEKSCEDFDKPKTSGGEDFPTLKSNLPSIKTEEGKSCHVDFDKLFENNINDAFPALVSKLPCIEPENEKSIVITQEAPKFSYATVLAKTTSTSPSAIPAKKVVHVAPSDTESCPCTGPIIVVGPKEKVVCVRGLPKKLKAVELIQALKKFGPVKLDSLQIRKSDYGSCSAALEFQSHDSARAAVESGKIKFGEHVGFISFRSAPSRYGSSMHWSQRRQSVEPTPIV